MKNRNKKLTRRQALSATLGSATLGAAGMVAVGSTDALAATRKGPRLKGKRVLVAIGDFSEGLETYYMVYRMIEEGAEPLVIAPAVKQLQLVVHDFDPQYTNYTEKLGYVIPVDVAFEDVDPAEYDGLLIPGGRGPEEIRQNDEMLKIAGYFLDNKLPLGAMCHGPQVLIAARRLKKRRIAASGSMRADIELAGATFVDEPVVVDGALVTSRGWPDLPYMMPKFIDVMAKKRKRE